MAVCVDESMSQTGTKDNAGVCAREGCVVNYGTLVLLAADTRTRRQRAERAGGRVREAGSRGSKGSPREEDKKARRRREAMRAGGKGSKVG